MGAWDFHALGNDAGLDELGLLFEKSNLVQHVRTSLEQDLHECPDEIRATAFMVYILAKEGLWPHDSLREITSLAISRLTRMQAEKVYRNANFVAKLRRLIGQLRDVAPVRTIGLPGCDPG